MKRPVDKDWPERMLDRWDDALLTVRCVAPWAWIALTALLLCALLLPGLFR